MECLSQKFTERFFGGGNAGCKGRKVGGGSNPRNEARVSRLRAAVEAGSCFTQRYLLNPRRAKNELPVPPPSSHAESFQGSFDPLEQIEIHWCHIRAVRWLGMSCQTPFYQQFGDNELGVV
ncbi:hypothetical protein TNCV_1423921 [Trichonephila clavipes]|nr:hypothetical protein TNCV_1423921 [Trichonephila clavipes]